VTDCGFSIHVGMGGVAPTSPTQAQGVGGRRPPGVEEILAEGGVAIDFDGVMERLPDLKATG
jgi:hypothetical protein